MSKHKKKKGPRHPARVSLVELREPGIGSIYDWLFAVVLFILAGWLGGL